MISSRQETLIQFIKFCINGGILGIAAWVLQLFVFKILDNNSPYAYATATCLTFIPLVIINFFLQRRFIFRKPGFFLKFIISNMSIMILVAVLSFYCKTFLDNYFFSPVGTNFGFALANLIAIIPSFLLQKFWVFGNKNAYELNN